MSTMTPEELLALWTQEKITIEMAIGHILQNLVKLRLDAKTAGASRYTLRSDVDALIAHAELQPRARKKATQ
jgi:hypothetical protein